MKILDKFHQLFLSEETKKKSEKTIVIIAIISFFLHLTLIVFNKINIIDLNNYAKLLNNPIAAIYTPFSFIIVYEVYLLIYYLPKSTLTYIGKQYEIISLILIRRIFKDMSNLKLTENWFNEKYDLIFMADLIAILILFYLIYKFYRLNDENNDYLKKDTVLTPEIENFIQTKKNIATLLVPILIILSVYSLGKWINESFFSITKLVYDFKDVNNIFFDDFFTILILVDVFLLLFSFIYFSKFSKVIRNSAFIISTIMLKISFAASGILNIIFIVLAVVFGVLILAIHNKYEKLKANI